MAYPRNPIPTATISAMLQRWGDGESGAQIGQALGITRNAVIGKVNRLRINFGAAHLTLECVADHIAAGGDVTDFDKGEPLGEFALAEIRRGLGRQAR